MRNDRRSSGLGVPHPETIYLRESELALRWRTSERTLQRWRQAVRHYQLQQREESASTSRLRGAARAAAQGGWPPSRPLLAAASRDKRLRPGPRTAF